MSKDVAVIRDNDDKYMYLVGTDYPIDTPRLEEVGYKLEGWLRHSEQWQADDGLYDKSEPDNDLLDDESYHGPLFTNCMHQVDPNDKTDSGLCNVMIAMSYEGGAPTYCTPHEELHEDE
jgi:hypothetical protein